MSAASVPGHSDAGRYRTIVADPPWPIEWRGGRTRVNGRGVRHRLRRRTLDYETLPVAAIAALSLAELAADDAHLFLWIPTGF